jgi:hypothetical protein
MLRYASLDAVLTYKINKNDVGIMINKAVAVKPKILTSISEIKNKFLRLVLLKKFYSKICLINYA